MKTTEEWLRFRLKESERYQNYILNQKLNDASGLGGRLQKLVRRGRAERPAGVLLTGPAGSGRHCAAWHILQALDEEDCAPVFFTGAGLAQDAADFPDLAERLNALLDSFYDRGQGLCVVLEEPEDCPYCQQLYPYLGSVAQEYRLGAEILPPLFLILITRQQVTLPAMLQEQLLSCSCVLPDLATRRNYLEDRSKSIRNYVSLSRLAELSEGCSFGQLGQISEQLAFWVDTEERSLDDEMLEQTVKQFSPGKSDSQPQGQNPITAALDRLQTALLDLADRLSFLSVSKPVGATSKEKKEEPLIEEANENSMANDRSSVEKLPVHQLAKELFGEDRLQELLQN